MADVDRSGRFKATIGVNKLHQGQTGSVSWRARFALTEFWDGAEWLPWGEYDQSIEGQVNIIKKDGNANDRGVQTMKDCVGWTGDFAALDDGDFSGTTVQITVEQENDPKYGQRFVVAWVNAGDPPAQTGVDVAGVKALNAKFGAMMRAKLKGATSVPPKQVPRPANVGPSKDVPF